MLGLEETVTFKTPRGIFSVGSLATMLKALEGAGNIGPWHISHWTDFTHTAIQIRFHSVRDAALAKRSFASE